MQLFRLTLYWCILLLECTLISLHSQLSLNGQLYITDKSFKRTAVRAHLRIWSLSFSSHFTWLFAWDSQIQSNKKSTKIVTSAGSNEYPYMCLSDVTRGSLDVTKNWQNFLFSAIQSLPPSMSISGGSCLSPSRHMCSSHSKKVLSKPCFLINLKRGKQRLKFVLSLTVRVIFLIISTFTFKNS